MKENFIASGVKLIESDNIKIGSHSSIWYNCVLRADMSHIEIGDFTNIQDLTCVHVDDNMPTVIGDYVTIGHGCVIHACEIADNTLIGMGATVLSGAKIGKNCIIGANSLVKENMIIPDNTLVVGVPAKIKKKLSDNTSEELKNHALKYWEIAKTNMNSKNIESY